MAAVRERRLPHLTLQHLPSFSCSASSFPIPAPSAAPASSSNSDHCLADFERLGVLGRGNGGTVYKVRHRRTSEIFALKILNAPQEVDILRRVGDHPAVVGFRGAVPYPCGDYAVLLELMDSGSLDSLILRSRRQCRPIGEAAVAGVAFQTLLGLAHLHSLRIVHRDIKPANLLLSTSGEVKIADFGVGEIVQRGFDRRCVSYVGTCAYLSPERFDPDGAGYDGFASDVWALGVTLMELTMGRFPLLPEGEKPDWAALMWAICLREPPEMPAAASAELRDFLSRFLKKEPRERWTVAQLLRHPFVARIGRSEAQCAVRELLLDSEEH